MFRATARIGKTVASRSKQVSKRNMGGHGGHGGHGKPAGPYDPPHHDAYPSEAYPLGLVPGAPLEGWEGITIATYIICTGILIVGISNKQDDFKGWARSEALAREKIVEEGGTIEFGTYYGKHEFDHSCEHGVEMPKKL